MSHASPDAAAAAAGSGRRANPPAASAAASRRTAVEPGFDPNTFAGMRRLLREDLHMHGNDRTRPGYRAMRAYRFGVWRMSVGQPLRAPLSVLYRWMYRRCRDGLGIELPYSATIGRRLTIEHQNGIVVHGNAVIGDDCTIRQGCTLGNKTPDRPFDAPVLGNGVNVGAGAKILGAVTLGDKCQVGANAVVVKDVPAGVTVVGIPARALEPRRHGDTENRDG